MVRPFSEPYFQYPVMKHERRNKGLEMMGLKRSNLENQLHKKRCEYDKAAPRGWNFLKISGFEMVNGWGSKSRRFGAWFCLAPCRHEHRFKRCKRQLPSFPLWRESWSAKNTSFSADLGCGGLDDQLQLVVSWCIRFVERVSLILTTKRFPFKR